jgi:peptidoglycan hydrolase CwlO-like protein
MAPHNDPTNLPLEDQLTLMRDDIESIDLNLSSIKYKQSRQDDQFKLVRSDIKSLKTDLKNVDKKFDKQEKVLAKWKDQLFNKIDKFMGRIRSQDQEIAAISFRSSDHQERITKLEIPTA